MEKFKVYLAGPITGLAYDEIVNWRRYIRKNLPDGIVGYSPMRAKAYLQKETQISHSYEESLLSSQRGLFTHNMNDCRICDALMVNFLNSKKVSIGTVMEISAFWWQRKPIILIMQDGNIHDHPMIREACPLITYTLDEAIHVVTSILLPVGH